MLAPLSPQEVHEDQLQLKPRRQKAKEKSVDKQKKGIHFLGKNNEIKKALYLQQPLLLFIFKDKLMTSYNFAPELPSGFEFILQEYAHVFQKRAPMDCHQLEELNTKLIWFLELLNQTDQHTEPTLKKLWNYRGRLAS